MPTSQCPAIRDHPPTPCGANLPLRNTESTHNTERLAPRPWITHLEGRTLVEGLAEAFRHPNPDCPDPIAELLPIRDAGWENLMGIFMGETYPEDRFSPDERERMRDAFRDRFVEGSRDGHAQFRREIADLQATSPDVAMQMEERLAMNMASDETSRVLMVYFMLGMLRMGGVIAERMELQDKGVLEVDCPVCLGQLTSGNGFVTFHLLECGHRVHEECLLQIEETPDAAGGVVRTCPLCRGASRVTRTFVMKGAMA